MDIRGNIKLKIKVPIKAKTTLPINSEKLSSEYTKRLESLFSKEVPKQTVIDKQTVETSLYLDNRVNPKHTAKLNTRLSKLDQAVTAIKLSRSNNVAVALEIKQEIKEWFKSSSTPLKDIKDIVESRFITLDKLEKDYIYRDMLETLKTVEEKVTTLVKNEKAKTLYTLTMVSSNSVNSTFVNYGFLSHFSEAFKQCGVNLDSKTSSVSLTLSDADYEKVWPLIQERLSFMNRDKGSKDLKDNTYSIEVTTTVPNE